MIVMMMMPMVVMVMAKPKLANGFNIKGRGCKSFSGLLTVSHSGAVYSQISPELSLPCQHALPWSSLPNFGFLTNSQSWCPLQFGLKSCQIESFLAGRTNFGNVNSSLSQICFWQCLEWFHVLFCLYHWQSLLYSLVKFHFQGCQCLGWVPLEMSGVLEKFLSWPSFHLEVLQHGHFPLFLASLSWAWTGFCWPRHSRAEPEKVSGQLQQ